MHPYVELAVKAIREYVRNRKMVPPLSPLPDDMKVRSGVFVSIKKGGVLRGCIGTIAPLMPDLSGEIVSNAICAATRDGRFPPVEPEELDGLTVNVDVLSPPEPVDSIAELDPKKYGVIIESGGRRGLLLPDIEGVNTPEEQIEICRRKAGILRGEEITLLRFTVARYF